MLHMLLCSNLSAWDTAASSLAPLLPVEQDPFVQRCSASPGEQNHGWKVPTSWPRVSISSLRLRSAERLPSSELPSPSSPELKDCRTCSQL